MIDRYGNDLNAIILFHHESNFATQNVSHPSVGHLMRKKTSQKKFFFKFSRKTLSETNKNPVEEMGIKIFFSLLLSKIS